LNVEWIRILKAVNKVYFKVLPRHLPGDANELLLFGASKLKEASDIEVASYQSDSCIGSSVGKKFFSSPSRKELRST
jgi:hypothetical protein